MQNSLTFYVSRSLLSFIILFSTADLFAQQKPVSSHSKSDFWNNVQFGGGFGAAVGSGYTDLTLAPSAIYNFNEYVAAGVGLQGSYVSSKDYFSSAIYGASLITLFNPIEDVQLSVELEQLRVNSIVKDLGNPDIKNNFWNTALFIGGGFRANNVTIGARYNVLYNKRDYVYSGAFMPFIRVYF
ncbi:MAG: hypothetical protein V4548_11920 [Bacteroidota bacterium]